jgi:hypothetical protein
MGPMSGLRGHPIHLDWGGEVNETGTPDCGGSTAGHSTKDFISGGD